MFDKLKSRKLWVGAGAMLVLYLNTKLGLGIGDETMKNIVNVAMTYLGAQGVVDVAAVFAAVKGK
jgi:uncharacterized membrane protein